MIIEYMLIKESGKMTTPSWISDGGYYRDPDNFTMLGWTPDPGVREFYVPDSVLALTLEQTIARVLDIHSRHPMIGIDENILTSEQITAQVTEWYNSKEQGY